MWVRHTDSTSSWIDSFDGSVRAPNTGCQIDAGQVSAKYILAALALVLLITAALRLARGGGLSHPQTRTWLLVAVIFAVVSAWLFARG